MEGIVIAYPPARYHAEHGASSAWFRAADAEPPGYTTAAGTAGHYLASTNQTEGLFSLFRWEMSPSSAGPSPHFHRTVSGTFYILEGCVRLYDGDRWFDAYPGDLLHVPAGGVHGFANTSGARPPCS